MLLGMSLTQPPRERKKSRTTRDGQLMLRFDGDEGAGRIPEPSRSRCVSLLRKMLERVIRVTNTEN